MSSFSFPIHAIRKEASSLIGEASRLRSSELETRSPDQVEARILHVTLDGGSLSQQLMCRNKPYTATNTTQLARILERKSLPFVLLLLSPLLFFPPSDEKRERKHGGPFKGEDATKPVRILVNFEKFSEVEDDRLPPDLLYFIDKWMSSQLSMQYLKTHKFLKSQPTILEDTSIEEAINKPSPLSHHDVGSQTVSHNGARIWIDPWYDKTTAGCQKRYLPLNPRIRKWCKEIH